MKNSKLKSFLAIVSLNVVLATGQTQLIKEYDLNFYAPSPGGFPNEWDAQHIEKFNNHYLIGGGKNFGTSSSPNQDPVLVQLNSVGSLTGFNKRYSTPNTQYATHVTAINSSTISDAGYLLSGVTATSGNLEFSNFLIKTNLAGGVVWKKAFTITNANGDNIAIRINQVIQASNSKVYIAGRLRKSNTSSPGYELVILKINPFNGNIEWFKIYAIVGTQDFRTNGIMEENPGKFVVFGATKTTLSNSFIFSFQDGSSGPTSPNFKLVTLSHPQANGVDCSITSMHYYQGAYLVGGNEGKTMNGTGYQQIFMFRLDNNLNNPTSLGGAPAVTSSYLNTQYPLLTHITSNAAGIILTGDVNPASSYTSFVMVLGSNGSIINAKKGAASIQGANTSVDCFKDGSGFITLHQRLDGLKNARFTKYSSIGFTCEQANLPNSSPFNDNISITTIEPVSHIRAMQVSEPNVTVIDFEVNETSVCETCITTPTAGPITTSTGNNYFCTGTPFALNAPPGFSNYVWTLNGNAAGNGTPLNISVGGAYTVYMFDEFGCEAQQTTSITSYDNCVINVAPRNVSYCSLLPGSVPAIGWPVNPLSDCNGKWKYTWYYNGTQIAGGSYTTAFQGAGVYSVVAQTPCGLQSFAISVTDQLINYMNHPSALPMVTNVPSYPTFIPATSPPAGYTYSWTVVNLSSIPQTTVTGTSSFISIPSYNYGETLQVTLVLTDLVGCKRYHNTITYNDNPSRRTSGFTGVSEQQTQMEENAKIFPNPATDKFTIEVNDFEWNNNYKVVVTAIDGTKLIEEKIKAPVSEINLSDISPGIYYVQVTNGSKTMNQVLIKKP